MKNKKLMVMAMLILIVAGCAPVDDSASNRVVGQQYGDNVGRDQITTDARNFTVNNVGGDQTVINASPQEIVEIREEIENLRRNDAILYANQEGISGRVQQLETKTSNWKTILDVIVIFCVLLSIYIPAWIIFDVLKGRNTQQQTQKESGVSKNR